MPMSPSIHELRPSRVADQELEWFFNSAEGDMGLRSNFLASLGRRGPGGGALSPEDAVDAAHRYRKVRGWLGALEGPHAEVLRSAYELRDWPVVLWDALGRLTGVVVRLACAGDVVPVERRAQEILEMDRATWLALECLRPETDPSFTRLRAEAQARFARAGFAYAEVRGGTPIPSRKAPR
jgi:hypothetical protein